MVFEFILRGVFANLEEDSLVTVKNQVDVCKSMAKSDTKYDVLTHSTIRLFFALVQTVEFNHYWAVRIGGYTFAVDSNSQIVTSKSNC